MSEVLCRVFDLCLAVPFPVGSALQAPVDAPADVQVLRGSVPVALPQAVHTYAYPGTSITVQVDGAGAVLLQTAVARFHVVQGRTVTIDAAPDLAASVLRYMTLHFCVPVLLNQRGMIALHANALATPRGAVVISGQSGGGKSTLHAALLARGMAMLSDDVAVLRRCPEGVEVLPGLRRYRMVADAWERVQPPAEQVVRLGGPRNKIALVAPISAYRANPAPLAAVYVLEPYSGDEIVVARVQGFAAFRLLQAQAYPPLESMALPEHLRSFGALIDRLAVYRVRRPAQRWTVDELADIVLAADPLTPPAAPQLTTHG
jgi:hypothetical protein